MVRTQIYIPKTLHQRAKQVAKQQDTSLAALIREYIEEGLNKEQGRGKNTLDDLAKLKITGGPKDLSSRMDEYLYGGK